MGYLDEAGLAALVGKVKGQMVELTAAEYAQIDPAIKNYDNKLYFVKNDVSGYQIDNEPVANSDGLVRSGGIYNWTSKIGSGTLITTAQTLIPAVNEVNTKIGSGTLTTTAQTLIPAVNEVNTKIGSTDISTIGDGTVTGAVNALNNGLIDVFSYDERKVGTWVDGKPLYRKTVYRSSLPNSTSTNYQHGIANVDTIFLDSGHSFIRWSSGSTAPLPYLSTSYSSAVDVNSVSSTTYTVNTHGADRSALSGYFTFLYTKTTD